MPGLLFQEIWYVSHCIDIYSNVVCPTTVIATSFLFIKISVLLTPYYFTLPHLTIKFQYFTSLMLLGRRY